MSIVTTRKIECDVCGECFGEVPGRDPSRVMLRDAGWRNLDALDVCPGCQDKLEIVGSPHPKAWAKVKEAAA